MYENAPATKILATHCACCGRPLLDAQSVEVGVGPVCREKYMFADAVSEAARQEGNKLIYKIARQQVGPEVTQAMLRLEELGLVRVAERIKKRLRLVSISYEGGRIYVRTPAVSKGTFPAFLKAIRSIGGRKWERAEKVNSFPTSERKAVWEVLKEYFCGCNGVGPKGAFQIN